MIKYFGKTTHIADKIPKKISGYFFAAPSI